MVKHHMMPWLRLKVTFLSLLASLAGIGAAGAQPATIRVFTADLSAAPYVTSDGVTFLSGIIKDLNDEAARRAGVRVEYSVLARGSVDSELDSGAGHVTCNIQPAWTSIADKLVWTKPLFNDEDIYWRRIETPALQSVEDLIGHSFATYQGYTHGDAVTRQVADGQTKRVDLYASQSALDALLRKRADYVIFSRIRGEFLLKDPKYAGKIEKAGLADSSYSNFCAISRLTPIPAEAYKAALDSVLEDGTLDRILTKYR